MNFTIACKDFQLHVCFLGSNCSPFPTLSRFEHRKHDCVSPSPTLYVAPVQKPSFAFSLSFSTSLFYVTRGPFKFFEQATRSSSCSPSPSLPCPLDMWGCSSVQLICISSRSPSLVFPWECSPVRFICISSRSPSLHCPLDLRGCSSVRFICISSRCPSLRCPLDLWGCSSVPFICIQLTSYDK
ncbi:hypothetical protein KP509_23G063400 [Ceratopteris richardii]|uniref:Uncharacterized protein n=1 Tax=Ceratopteris richardii TaxID=49495 RepID=A0A8T2S199_CERRI|nr:hypothetical protein KP509_23G063300 [Ceratopteris richardii]KAH7302273.1 hypothetical protein KP509_23G063400 [Ceratopteris richardii]